MKFLSVERHVLWYFIPSQFSKQAKLGSGHLCLKYREAVNRTTCQGLNDWMEQSSRKRSRFQKYFTENGRRVPSIICYSTVCICWSINSEQPILRQNQMNQLDFKANTCSRYKAREKSVSKSWFILFSILTGWYSWVRVSANHLQKVLGKSK